MIQVSAHKFKSNYTAEEVDDDLEFMRSKLGGRLETDPAGAGKHVDAHFLAGCWAHSIGRSIEALELFQASTECSGAMFAAISAEPRIKVVFGFRGKTLTGPSGPPKYGSLPPYWVKSLVLAVALQRAEIAEAVLAVPVATLQKAPGEVDACFIHLVHALQAFFSDRAFEAHLDEFGRLSRPEALKLATPRILERFRALDPILRAIAARDEPRLNEVLAAQLEAHKKLYGQGKEAKDPEGLIDVHVAGLMRVALDRGLKLDVESDYVPKWLIGLEKP